MYRILVGSTVLCFGLFGLRANAKGLNDISAEADVTPPEQAPAAEQSPKEEAPKEEPKGSEPVQGDAATSATKEPDDQDGESEESPIERSEFSKKIENRLYLSPSMNFGKVTGKEGKWSSAANGNAEIGWRVKEGFIGSGKLFATVRYAPFDFVLSHNKRSYRGVAEGWYLGAQSLVNLSEKLFIAGSTSIGYFKVHLDSADGQKVLPEDEIDSGFGLAIAGGIDREVLEKFNVGARMGLGFGSFKTVQIGVATTFFF